MFADLSRQGTHPRDDVDQACDDPLVIHLVTRAGGGGKRARDALAEPYAPLIWSICRKYRFGRDDADGGGQSAWMRPVDQLKIHDPAVQADWLAATRRECGHLVRAAHAPDAVVCELDAEIISDERAEAVEQEPLVAGRHVALRAITESQRIRTPSDQRSATDEGSVR